MPGDRRSTIRLDERNGRKSFGIDSGEEVRRILDMRGALRGIAHDGRGVGLEVADVAVGSPDLDERTWLLGRAGRRWQRCTRRRNRPGDILLIESFADSPGIDGGIVPPLAMPAVSTVPSGESRASHC